MTEADWRLLHQWRCPSCLLPNAKEVVRCEHCSRLRPIVLRATGRRPLVFAVGFALFAAMGVFIALTASPAHPSSDIAFGALVAVVGSAGTAYLILLALRPGRLALTEGGLEWTDRRSHERVAWEDTDHFGLAGGEPFIMPELGIRLRPDLRRGLTALGAWDFVLLQSFGLSFPALSWLLDHYRAVALEERSRSAHETSQALPHASPTGRWAAQRSHSPDGLSPPQA